MKKSIVSCVLLLIAALISSQSLGQPVKQYDVYKLESKIGKEVVRSQTHNQASITYIDIVTNDRGTAMKLNAVVSFNNYGVKYISKGNTSRFKTENIDTTSNQKESFCLSDNGSISVRELLVNFWLEAGKPVKIISALTGKPISVTFINHEPNPLNGNKLSVFRLNNGLDEILWLDENNKAVYLTYCDTEGDKREVLDNRYSRYLFAFNEKSNSYLIRSTLQNNAINAQRFSTMAIVGGNIIDVVHNGAMLSNSLLLLKNGKIEYIGRYDKALIPPGAKVIDATSKYLIPGLWNMHVHIFHPEYIKRELLTGVTSVRDMGNEFDLITLIRQETNTTSSAFPYVYSAGLIDGKSKNSLGTVLVDSEKEIKGIVKRYYDAGFNQIKIYSYIKKNSFNSIVQQAIPYHMQVVGHLPVGYTLNYFVDNGISSLSHIHYFMNNLKWGGNLKQDNEMLLDKLLSHKVYIDPTLNVYNLTHDVKLPYYNRIVKLLFDYGVPIVAGTDNEGTVAQELQSYVKAGLTPLEAIRTATIVPAIIMKADTQYGSIEKGKNSDILILDANPLVDIANLSKISYVTKGEWVISNK